MRFTLFGYPGTGKTTLFNLLTNAGISLDAYGKQKKEPNLRTVKIPDERLDTLHSLYPDKEKKQAAVDFIDLAGSAYGEIKESAYLNHLRTPDGLVHVVRGFRNPKVPFSRETMDIQRDIRSMEEELILADLMSVESRLEKLAKELARSKNPEGEKEKELLGELRNLLENGSALRGVSLPPAEEKQIRHFAFLSRKPLLHAVNVDEQDILLIGSPERLFPTPSKGTAVFAFCGSLESEIMELGEEEKKVFLKEYGLSGESIPRFLIAAYSLLDVITFYTIGDKEIKAWPIGRESTALQAAGAIHTDIARGFIKAEVTPVRDLLKLGSIPAAREKAAVRLEGKEYIVQDGDVIYFRFAK